MTQDMKSFSKLISLLRHYFFSLSENWDPKVVPADDLVGEITLYVDELMNNEDVERLGVVLIVDMAGFGMKHAKTATPSQMHKIVNIFHVSQIGIEKPVKIIVNSAINYVNIASTGSSSGTIKGQPHCERDVFVHRNSEILTQNHP